MLDRTRAWLRAVFLRRRLEREMQEEMATHLALSAERLMARGMTPEEARLAARREFGNVASLQEEARDARGAVWVASIAADLRFGLRHFARTPFSTAAMVVLLALGIGFNTALFTVLYSFAGMPPPGIPRDEALVRIRGSERSAATGLSVGREFSYPEYRDYAAERRLFAAVAAWSSSDVVLDPGGAEGESLRSAAATFVTANYFQVLGVRPVLGAGLPAALADDGAPEPVAVISHALWERAFGRAPDVVGRTVRVNAAAVTIVGVAPPRFAGARTGGSRMRLWLPLNARPLVQGGSAVPFASHDSLFLGLAARLAPGVEAGDAVPAVRAIAARWRAGGAASADVVPLLADNYFPPSGERPSLAGRAASLLIPLLVLAICCINVSGLLVGLAAARRREIGVRLSLGASRRRIVRQLVTESVLLALAAALLGLVVIGALLRAFGARVPDLQLVLHWPAAAFAFGLGIATGIVFGVSPALHATRVAVAEVLKDSAASVSGARSRLQSGLAVAQVALTQPLLFGLGVLVLGMRDDLRRLPDSPFSERIVQVRFNTNPRYGAMDQAREDVLQRLRERLAALPGVEGVVAQADRDGYTQVDVHPGDRMHVVGEWVPFWIRTRAAPPGFFPLMGFPLVRGRDFSPAERAGGEALIIRSDLARRLWGTADPVGRRLVHVGGEGTAGAYEVVGVVDAATAGESGTGDQSVFVPAVGTTGSFLVRTRGPAEPMISRIRSLALAEAPSAPVTGVTTLAAIGAAERSRAGKVGTLVGAVGSVALFISAVGLYAVVAFGVGQRTREIGIRTALGADRRRVVRMFVFRGVRLGLLGLLAGLVLSLAVHLLSDAEDGGARAPVLAASIAAVVMGTALLATWIPARRAATVDPIVALRGD